jgi:hypothetical protein
LIDPAQSPFREADWSARVASLRVERDALLQERERLRAEIARYSPWSAQHFWLGVGLPFFGLLVATLLRWACH